MWSGSRYHGYLNASSLANALIGREKVPKRPCGFVKAIDENSSYVFHYSHWLKTEKMRFIAAGVSAGCLAMLYTMLISAAI